MAREGLTNKVSYGGNNNNNHPHYIILSMLAWTDDIWYYELYTVLPLTRVQHINKSTLLILCNSQVIHRLNFNPHLRVGAIIRSYTISARLDKTWEELTQRRLPVLRSIIALLTVNRVRHREELRVLQVIGESLTLVGGPVWGPTLIFQ